MGCERVAEIGSRQAVSVVVEATVTQLVDLALLVLDLALLLLNLSLNAEVVRVQAAASSVHADDRRGAIRQSGASSGDDQAEGDE